MPPLDLVKISFSLYNIGTQMDKLLFLNGNKPMIFERNENNGFFNMPGVSKGNDCSERL
jgi:hypothetical protein